MTEQPATEAPPAADALALVAPTTVITQYEVLIDDIKEAKAETLERGKAIDRVKNVLREQVAALIQPHQDALDAIAKAEAERVAKHRLWITTVQDLARVPFGSDSEGIKEMMLELDLYEQSVDLLEEFTLEGKAALVDTTRVLREAHTKALTEEAAAAELARLREEARLQAEKDAAAKAAKDAEDAAAEVARKAQEAADAAALAVIEEAEQKVAAAQAEAAAATRRALDAEAVADALQSEALLAIKPAEPPTMEISDQAVAGVRTVVQGLARSIPKAVDPLRLFDAQFALRKELCNAMAGMTMAQVVEALTLGTLHPAIKIDWAAMGPIPPTP